MYDFIIKKIININHINAIEYDGTAVNTGAKACIIRPMEQKLKKIHWFIYQLHGKELPLRHLIQFFDGKTASPKASLAVRNCVKLVTEATSLICGENSKMVWSVLGSNHKIKCSNLKSNVSSCLKCSNCYRVAQMEERMGWASYSYGLRFHNMLFDILKVKKSLSNKKKFSKYI